MTSMTTQSMAPTKWAVSLFSILALAFCLTLAVGATPAYAEVENAPVTCDNDSGAADGVDGGQLALAEAAVEDEAPAVGSAVPSADPDIAGPADGASELDAGGDTLAAPTSEIAQNQPDKAAAASLSAADDPAYPGDDGTAGVFIGLEPRLNDSYNADKVVRDEETNAVHVYLSSEVGNGVSLIAVIEYFRVGTTVYDFQTGAYSAISLPFADTSEYTMASIAEGLMYTWYVNGSLLGQGTYYTDPTTNPALSGGGIAGATSLVGYDGVDIEDFINDRSTQWGVSAYQFMEPGSYPFCREVPYAYDESFDGNIELWSTDMTPNDSGRYLSSPVYFEEPGERTIAVQFTYVQEYRSKNTADENVGYVLYASNPVVFHISVADALVAPTAMTFVASDAATTDPIDISSPDFIIDLVKESTYDAASGGDKYLFAYCSMAGNTYAVTTPGMYTLTVTHVTNLYKQYVETFRVDEAMISGGPFSKLIILEQNTSLAQYSVTFYWDDGVTVIPVSGTDESGASVTVDSKLYNDGTVAEYVWKPAHPVKPATEDEKYVFKEWKGVSAADGSPLEYSGLIIDHVYPVTCDAKYIAVFRTIPLKNSAGKRIVYATGGLFSSDAKPAGVLSYVLSSSSLTPSEASSVIAAHSDIMSEEKVLGMVRVDLTQYNDDAECTTTDVTEHEGLEGMTLKFNMEESGIAVNDGDKLKIIQIHKKDESSPEEIIEHKATVEGGEVEITLEGKLSTFVFLMDDSSSEGEGTEGGTTDPEGGNTSGEGGPGTEGGTTDPEQGGASGEGASGEGGSTSGDTPSGSGEESSKTPTTDSGTGTETAYAQEAGETASAAAESTSASSAKASSAAIGSSMPATGDSMGLLAIALAALAELVAAIAVCVSVRRRAQL